MSEVVTMERSEVTQLLSKYSRLRISYMKFLSENKDKAYTAIGKYEEIKEEVGGLVDDEELEEDLLNQFKSDLLLELNPSHMPKLANHIATDVV